MKRPVMTICFLVCAAVIVAAYVSGTLSFGTDQNATDYATADHTGGPDLELKWIGKRDAQAFDQFHEKNRPMESAYRDYREALDYRRVPVQAPKPRDSGQ